MKGVDQDTSLTTRSERWQFLLLDGDSLYVAFKPLHLTTTFGGAGHKETSRSPNIPVSAWVRFLNIY